MYHEHLATSAMPRRRRLYIITYYVADAADSDEQPFIIFIAKIILRLPPTDEKVIL